MTTNALMQLAAYGEQDIFLTADPQITFWKYIYNKYTNFAIESISQTVSGITNFGNKISCIISKEGDLMWRTYLEVTLPSLNTTNNTYSNRIGFRLLKQVDLFIGGQKIDTHYSTWMHVWTELTHNTDKKALLDKLVGNKGIDGLNGDNNNPGKLNIPLLFFFCTDIGLALPLIALQYHEIEIIITLETFNNCITDLNINNDVAQQNITDILLWVDYIFLDTDERRAFAQYSHEYLIEILQKDEQSISPNGSSFVDLTFNHPTKLLAFVLRDESLRSGGNTCIEPMISLGGNQTMVIRSDGTLWGWGGNILSFNSSTPTIQLYGLLGLGTDVYNQSTPVQITGIGTNDDDYRFVSSGGINSFVIKSDGTLWGSGTNSGGSLGVGDSTIRYTFVQIGTDTNWSKISAGATHTLGIKTDGTLWSWGRNVEGQLGLGNNTSYNTPQQVGSDTDWKDIYVFKSISTSSGTSSAVIKINGTLWVCGYNLFGQLGLGDTTNRNVFTQIGSASWLTVSCSSNWCMGIQSNGSLWSWGTNTSGQLGLGNTTTYNTPQQVGSDTNWTQVSNGTVHAIAKKNNNTIWSVGSNSNGQLCRSTNNYAYSDTFVQIGSSSWSNIYAGSYFTCFVDSNYNLYFGGLNAYGQFGQYYLSPYYTVPTYNALVDSDVWISNNTPNDITLFTNGSFLLIKSNGTLWATGNNNNGQLGLGDTIGRLFLSQVGTDTNWSKVYNSGGRDGSSAAIKTNGTLWTCGLNAYGQLGLNNFTNRTVFTQVGTSTNWVSVSIGNGHMVGIQNDGTLWAWGYNFFGQLGRGNNTNSSVPIKIGTDINWASVQASFNYTIALKTTGTIWSTGQNTSGQLGLGNNTNINTFAQIGSSTWTSVMLGFNCSFGIKTDGTLWSWGSGTFGQLGLGNTTSYNTPQQIGTSTWSKISSNTYSSKGIQTDGTLWSWGTNLSNSIGNNTFLVTSNQLSPIQLGTDTDWTQIYASMGFNLAIKNNNTKWIWGVVISNTFTFSDFNYIDLTNVDFVVDNCISSSSSGLSGIDYFTYFASYNNNVSTLSSAKLMINGTDRFEERDSIYFNYIQPYQHFNIKPDIGINVYSFALKPAEHYPSGSINLSKVDKLVLKIVPTTNANNTTNIPLKLTIYSYGYNILRISSGMGGLAFSN